MASGVTPEEEAEYLSDCLAESVSNDAYGMREKSGGGIVTSGKFRTEDGQDVAKPFTGHACNYYVGYGEGGQLTEAVRRHPYSVVLFDEIEKAHPEVFNTLLQIFDEGHLTDGSGRKVDFRNTVIILTSNVGSRAAAIRSTQVGYSTCSKSDTQQKAPQSEYRRALEETFAPEFLNRIDDIVIFRTLDLSDVERISTWNSRGCSPVPTDSATRSKSPTRRSGPLPPSATSANTASAPCAARCSNASRNLSRD